MKGYSSGEEYRRALAVKLDERERKGESERSVCTSSVGGRGPGEQDGRERREGGDQKLWG